MEMTLGYVFDAALMVLLCVAIWFGVRLHRQIAAIREGRKELENLIKDFSGATDRAESALAELKNEVGDTLSQARHSARQAAELCDDLEFLIKRGDKVADSLAQAVRVGQPLASKETEDYDLPRPTQNVAIDPAKKEPPIVQTRATDDPDESLLKDALAAARQEAPNPLSQEAPSETVPYGGAAEVERNLSAEDKKPQKKVAEQGKSKTDLLKALRNMR